MCKTQKATVQILKCNHLRDGVRYSPSEVIAGKISACQCHKIKMIFHINQKDELHEA
jgi:hypothetical protein